MATFQVVVGDPETGDSYQFEVDDQDANRFTGRELGDEIDGSVVGLDGYTLELTGGSDTAGRPLRADVAGSGLGEVLLKERTTGYRPVRDGERKRVTVRGREITDEVVQINARVTEQGDTAIPVLLGEEEPADESADEDEADEDDAAAEAEDDEEEPEADEDKAAEEADAEADDGAGDAETDEDDEAEAEEAEDDAEAEEDTDEETETGDGGGEEDDEE